MTLVPSLQTPASSNFPSMARIRISGWLCQGFSVAGTWLHDRETKLKVLEFLEFGLSFGFCFAKRVILDDFFKIDARVF
jgi:hypothetical protein